MESGGRKLQENPCENANFLSLLFFGWTISLFKRAYGKILDANDVCKPLASDQSYTLGDRLTRKWREECKNYSKPSLLRAIGKSFWPDYVFLGFLTVIFDIVVPISLPFILKELLEYFREDSEKTQHDALAYGTGILLMTIANGMSCSHMLFRGMCVGVKVRVGVCNLVYQKSLQLSQMTLSDTAPGKLVNLLSNDVNRFEVFSYTVNSLWTSPLSAVIATYFLYVETGLAGMVGLMIIMIVAPLQSYVGKLSAVIRFKTALRTDERVRLMDEIISGVQIIKMYAWEKPFSNLIATARRHEIKQILRNGYVRAVFMTVYLCIIRTALFCTVVAIILMNDIERIRVSRIFMVSYLLMGISNSLCRIFVRAIAEFGETLVAVKRLEMFLEYEEKDQWTKNTAQEISLELLRTRNLAIFMNNVSAGWQSSSEKKPEKVGYKTSKTKNHDDYKPFELQAFNLEIPKGKLMIVTGPVGSGKSSLLQILLKELPVKCGSIGIDGTISYACQENWIFASTIRQNITFGQPMDHSRYNAVVQCTDLETDFEQLSDGDMTVVGENGTGLSGGQKARINLARSIYRKSDIYLIDDPLSSVDAHVQLHLFNNCIGPNSLLARQNATRILITHQIHFLKEADWIIVLKDGKIEMQGMYDEILKSGIDISSLMKQNDNRESEANAENGRLALSKNEKTAEVANNQNKSSKVDYKDDSDEKMQLLKELEETSKGKVKESVLWTYLMAAHQPFTLVFLVISILLTQILASLADIWISYWIRIEETRSLEVKSVLAEKSVMQSNNTEIQYLPDTKWSTDTYMMVCGGLIISLFVIAVARSITFYNFFAAASQNLHDMMFRGLISTKMRFFETNSSGRIMNRFSKDMGSVDEVLPKVSLDAMQYNLLMIGAVCVTVFTNIKFAVIVIILLILFLIARKVYLKCSKNIKRLEGMTKSPVFSHIAETLNGLSTIRAHGAEELLRKEFDNHQDLNTGVYFMFLGTSSGFGMSLDLMVYVFFTFVIYVFIFFKEGVTGDRVGLAITQSLSLVTILQWGVRQSAEVINMLTSVERVLEYSQLVPEKQPNIPTKVAADWPTKGKIEFKNVFYRYSNDHEPVLRGISFSVQPKEKVSVVGRTGAGKSSLIGSIFRLAIVEGDILIDGLNTSCINLHELRSRISIIPQEPTLFSGTLRRNLDPFEEYTDGECWNALENVGMKDVVSQDNGLQMPVLARGQNFSTGQRQILCLARAILRKNRIIILDEATANVDQRTDTMIQETIRKKFSDCTVIIVAHRLNTIIDSDRVLVMDSGKIIEFDKPYNLLTQENSVFRGMVEALGPQEFKRLSEIAEKCNE